MQATHATDGFMSGPQIKVISVAENDLRAQGFEHVLGDGLDGAGCAHWHEDRGFHHLVR